MRHLAAALSFILAAGPAFGQTVVGAAARVKGAGAFAASVGAPIGASIALPEASPSLSSLSPLLSAPAAPALTSVAPR
ncbi:MAG: hypothetical protein NUW21_15675, partial [Elusimicrobia bacterium]|nr:hypothetical protein [Elusimicrobiota bacterium]